MSVLEKRMIGNSEVIVCENVEDDVVFATREIGANGAVGIVFDRNLNTLASKIAGALKGVGHRVFLKGISSKRKKGGELFKGEKEEQMPEYVRYVLAVGAGSAATATKEISRALSADWSMVLCAPSTDCILWGNAPKSVFIDKNVMMNCPFECLAAGFGILLSLPLLQFEGFFEEKILAGKAPKFSVGFDGSEDAISLAVKLLQLSFEEREAGVKSSGKIMAEIMWQSASRQGRKPRLLGEYEFLASCAILSFYSLYLGALTIDCALPPCRTADKDKLLSLGFVRNSLKSVDFFDLNSYLKISYILSEYRTNLIDKLVLPHTVKRFWRRLYPDAGFCLKREVSIGDVLSSLVLAGCESESLLGFAYASGVLAKI